MCRLFAITSREPLSPMTAIHALNVMKEGHDGSGVGLFLTDLGGSFERFKGAPILSGIFSNEGIRTLDRCMMEMDFMVKYKRIPCPAHPVAPLVVPAEIAASVSGPAPAGSGSSWKIHP